MYFDVVFYDSAVLNLERKRLVIRVCEMDVVMKKVLQIQHTYIGRLCGACAPIGLEETFRLTFMQFGLNTISKTRLHISK